MPKGNVLVFGGGGYIGSHFCKELSRNGYQPIVFDNFSAGHKSFCKWGPYFEGDVRSVDDLEEFFRTYSGIAVAHFCAKTVVPESMENPAEYWENNVVGTLNLCNSAIAAGISNFIFSSTAALYGHSTEPLLSEQNLVQPSNVYGSTKMAAEEIIKSYGHAYGMKSICFRYFNAAGADQDCEIGEFHVPETHLIPILLEACLAEDGEFTVFGTDYDTEDGSAIRDFIHVCDLATAHLKGLEYLLAGGENEAFNLGTGTGSSVMEVVSKVKQVTGKQAKIRYGERRAGDPARLVANSAKAKEVLAWEPKASDLETIIGTSWRWLQKRLSENP